MSEIYSFDIFDTVLTRATASPVDIFRLLYYDIISDYAELASVDREEFVWSRQLSEKRALKKSNGEEASLNNICKELAQIFPFLKPSRICEIELSLERKYLFPVQKLVSIIEEKRKVGSRIVFISDTYLPETFLRSLLDEHGILRDGDRLYVSSSLQLTKRSGSIYPYVLSDLQADACTVIHYGDNKWSDINQANRHGVKTVWIRDSFPTEHERQVLIRLSTDGIAASILVGLSKYYRLRESSLGKSTLVGNFLGPFSVLMALWVIRKSAQKGASMTLFCSRDMFLTWRAAMKIARSTKIADVCGLRYFFVSRQSLYLPSLSYTNTLQDWILRPFDEKSPYAITKKLGFNSIEELSPVTLNIVNEICKNNNTQGIDRLCNALFQEPEVKASYTRAADSLLVYLKKLGMAKPLGTVCVADIGWSKTSQQFLHNALRHGFPAVNNTLHGLYLGLNNTRMCSSDSLSSEAMFYQPMHKELGDYFHPNTRATLLEHFIGLPAHSKVVAYDKKGNPVFDKGHALTSSHKKNKDLHVSHSRFLKGVEKIGYHLNLLGDDEVRLSIRFLIESFFRMPDKQTAGELSSILISCDQNDLAQRQACSPISIKEALFFYRTRQSHPWPEASMAITPKQTRILCSISEGLYSAYRRAQRKARALLAHLIKPLVWE
jgi:predicted HAD superfamily hydrolase